jgi:hypothetical protein
MRLAKESKGKAQEQLEHLVAELQRGAERSREEVIQSIVLFI